MNWKWMLDCILIYATASELCVASVLRQKMDVVLNEAEGDSEHFREIRQQKWCPYLQIENGAPCPEANQNEVCTIACNDNYDIQGITTVKCETNGEWSTPQPKCIPIKCPALQIWNADRCPETKQNEDCRVICFDNYALQGQATIKCETNGLWSTPQPKCILKKCPGFQIDNAAPCPETYQKEVCKITCNDNYEIEGEATLKCQTTGEWSTPHPKCILNKNSLSWKKCPPLQIENAAHFCPETYQKEQCTITCNDNYDIQGITTVKCETNGEWSTTQPKCIPKRIKCPVLQIINASKDPACSESYPDQECTVTCEDKFDLDGEDKIKCDSTGNWNREPKCNLSTAEGTQSIGTSGQRLTKIINNYNNFSCKDCIIVYS